MVQHRIFAQHASAESHIDQQIFQPVPTPCFACRLLDVRHIPKLAVGRSDGLLPGQTGGHQFLHLLFQVKGNFFVQIAV